MTEHYKLFDIARIPIEGDNCAVACKRLEKGTMIELSDKSVITLSHISFFNVNN